MAFNDDATKDGRGRAIRLDVSLDNWATISYRYSDVAGTLDGTNWYEARIINSPTVRRALGQNRIATSGGCSLELSNPDGGLDWLCGSAALSNCAKARFKLYVVLYDPSSPTSFTSKLLGDFFLSEWPRQTSTTISLSMSDAFMAPLEEGPVLPTFKDWIGIGTSSNNPVKFGAGLPDVMDESTPIQLAFGEDWVEAMPIVLLGDMLLLDAAYKDRIVFPLFCTTDTSAVSQGIITNFRVEAIGGAGASVIFDVPRETVGGVNSPAPGFIQNVWRVEKSPSITKGSKTFQIVYLVVLADLGNTAYSGFVPIYGEQALAIGDGRTPQEIGAARDAFNSQYEYANGYPPPYVSTYRHSNTGNVWAQEGWAWYGSRVVRAWVKGAPLSARTSAGPTQHAVDVATDLVKEYARGGLSVNATTSARVKAGTLTSRAAGVAYSWRQVAQGQDLSSMRSVLSALAQSSDIDIFMDWNGEVSFASDVWDFTTATQEASLVTIPETRTSGVERWIPGIGERGAPFNRLWFTGGKDNPADTVAVLGQRSTVDYVVAAYAGPFDFGTTTGDGYVLLTDKVLEASLHQGWRPWAQQAQAPWWWRNIDPRGRDRVRFVVGLDGLQLDLGDYFKLEWTDNRGAPYSAAAVFQVESIAYAAGDDAVEVEAIWRDDSADARNGYLLDDETLLVRTKSGSSTIDLNLTAGTVTMNNVGMAWSDPGFNVAVGDMLVVRDSTESATAFVRNSSWRIVSLDTDQQATITPTGSGTFTGIPNADWYVVRGATTYHTAVSDPTNYPSGGEMYGKVTNSSGNFSDSSEGNRLING